jgi:hypothetical protein
MIKCFEELNWDIVPEELEQLLLDYSKTTVNIDQVKDHPARARKFTSLLPNAMFSQFLVPKDFERWARKNLPITDQHVIRLQQFKNMPYTARHKDVTRASAFNYLLTDDNATTRWFDESGKEIDRIQYKQKVWYFHESRVFHQVINITQLRLAVTIFVPEMQHHEKFILD